MNTLEQWCKRKVKSLLGKPKNERAKSVRVYDTDSERSKALAEWRELAPININVGTMLTRDETTKRIKYAIIFTRK